MKNGLKVSFLGFAVETVGLILDILHHINIGIKTAEGLLTFNHSTIFVGFVIMSAGLYMTWKGQ